MLSFDYTLIVVLFGTLILGLVSGCLGAFALLRRQSLLGDAISHAALPGICIVFMLTYSKHPLLLLLGAAVAGWIGTITVMAVVRHTSVKEDAALGIILSVFFGMGLVFLTIIQRMPTAQQSGLSTYLFGSASTLLLNDVITMAVLGAITLGILLLFWKEFKLLTFDRDYAQSLGFPISRLDILITTLIVFSIVIGLQSVGVVLMSAMIIAPAASARQWTDKLSVMVCLSGVFGAVSGVIGALLSGAISKLPTGPTIVVVISIIVIVSLLFAPLRGIVWGAMRQRRYRDNIRFQTMLTNLMLFSESDTDPFYPHDIAALTAIGRGPARKAMADLKEKGLVVNPEADMWALTAAGLKEARCILADKIGGASHD